MRAAVIAKFGDVPRCQDFPDPTPGEGDVTVEVKAVAIENFDRLVASGRHYASARMFPRFPAIVGHGGVGALDDGTLVAFGGVRPPFGTMAEVAVVPRSHVKPVPAGVDAATAAVAPASVLTSLLPLRYGVKLREGETVLINGATGVAGRLAVQIARRLGAGRIVGSGRSRQGLAALEGLGVSATIDLNAPEEDVVRAFASEAGEGYDVVLDFVWGRPTELLLRTLVPEEVGFATRRVRFVQIGQSAGATIELAAETLRTSGLEMTGAGNVSPDVLPEAIAQTWDWIVSGAVHVDVEEVALGEVAEAWARDGGGSRLVIVP